MVLAIDVHYKPHHAKAVGLLFNWEDKTHEKVITATIDEVTNYISGAFYKRELPCILKLLEQTNSRDITAIIIDGHVYIDNNKTYGLGAHLWNTLKSKVPVIGVAKNKFFKNEQTVMEVYRGKSEKPLYVSAIGIDKETVAIKVKNMHGIYRFPTILKTLDGMTKRK